MSKQKFISLICKKRSVVILKSFIKLTFDSVIKINFIFFKARAFVELLFQGVSCPRFDYLSDFWLGSKWFLQLLSEYCLGIKPCKHLYVHCKNFNNLSRRRSLKLVSGLAYFENPSLNLVTNKVVKCMFGDLSTNCLNQTGDRVVSNRFNVTAL